MIAVNYADLDFFVMQSAMQKFNPARHQSFMRKVRELLAGRGEQLRPAARDLKRRYQDAFALPQQLLPSDNPDSEESDEEEQTESEDLANEEPQQLQQRRQIRIGLVPVRTVQSQFGQGGQQQRSAAPTPGRVYPMTSKKVRQQEEEEEEEEGQRFYEEPPKKKGDFSTLVYEEEEEEEQDHSWDLTRPQKGRKKKAEKQAQPRKQLSGVKRGPGRPKGAAASPAKRGRGRPKGSGACR